MNEQHDFVAGLVIEPTGNHADEYQRLGCSRVAANAGIVCFGLDQGLFPWDVTLV